MGTGLNEKLGKAVLITGVIFTILFAVFVLLNNIGILPFYLFSSIRCCALPALSLGALLVLVYAKKYRVNNGDRATMELVDRSIKLSLIRIATTVVIGVIATVLCFMIFIIFLFLLPQYFIFAIPAILIVAIGALIARIVIYFNRERLLNSAFLESFVNGGSPKTDGGVENPPRKEQRPVVNAPMQKSIIDRGPSDDGIKGIWYSPDKTLKAIFYPDKKFDIIGEAQPRKAGEYIGGTFRKDGNGHYWLRPEFEGTMKMTSRPVESPEMEFILEGNRLRKADDDSVQFFRFGWQ